MKVPFHTTLRAAGMGAVFGTLLSVPLAVATIYLGPAGFYGACLLMGVGAIAASHVMERRARRASNGEQSK